MLKKLFKSLKKSICRRCQSNSLYSVYEYNGADGNFDYERYRRVQTEGNKRKINNVWADQETIHFISDYILGKLGTVERGLCHGTRNGTEIGWFREKLGPVVEGTDISDTASSFPNTTQWDFHDVNPDWVGKFNFVYTNSHDHAYDPKKAMDAWVDQLAPGGMLFLEHTKNHTVEFSDELDPFGVQETLFPYVILKFAGGRYSVREILTPPHLKRGQLAVSIFVIMKN